MDIISCKTVTKQIRIRSEELCSLFSNVRQSLKEEKKNTTRILYLNFEQDGYLC